MEVHFSNERIGRWSTPSVTKKQFSRCKINAPARPAKVTHVEDFACEMFSLYGNSLSTLLLVRCLPLPTGLVTGEAKSWVAALGEIRIVIELLNVNQLGFDLFPHRGIRQTFAALARADSATDIFPIVALVYASLPLFGLANKCFESVGNRRINVKPYERYDLSP